MKLETKNVYISKVILDAGPGAGVVDCKLDAIAIAANFRADAVIHHSLGSFHVKLADLLNQITKIRGEE